MNFGISLGVLTAGRRDLLDQVKAGDVEIVAPDAEPAPPPLPGRLDRLAGEPPSRPPGRRGNDTEHVGRANRRPGLDAPLRGFRPHP
jgi:hypothetical protein